MREMIRMVVGLVFFLILAGGGIAQAQAISTPYEASGQLNIIWAEPQGSFEDHLDRRPVGASLLFGGVVPETPLFLGTEVAVLGYGHRQFLEIPRWEDIPLQSMVVSSSHSIMMGHLVARLQLPSGPIRPYVDGLAGIRSYVSSVQVDSQPLIFPVGFNSRASTTDWSFSYGGGGGVDIILFEGTSGLMHKPMRVSLNMGARYLFGTDADVAQLHDLQETNDRFSFQTVRTATNVLVPQIGIRINP